MADIAENLFAAVDILMNKKIEAISFDKTVSAVIVDDSEASYDRYVVNEGSIRYTAYSSGIKYKKDETVMVTIPQGNYENQKIIIGKITNPSTAVQTYVTPLERMMDTSGNILNYNTTNSIISFEANNPNAFEGRPWDLTTEYFDQSKVYQQTNCIWDSGPDIFYQGYTHLGFLAEFATLLRDSQIISGNFGIVIAVTFKCLDIEDIRYNQITRYLTFDSKDFFGDIYNYGTYQKQSQVFDISEYLSYPIVRLKVYAYQRCNFKNVSDQLIPYGIKKNLFVKNPYLCLGYDIEKFNGDTLQLLTDNSLTYYKDLTNEKTFEDRLQDNQKRVYLQWVHQDDSTKITNVTRTLPKGYELRWYKYLFGKKAPDRFAGAHWLRLDLNEFEYEFSPNINLASEQLKAIIIKRDVLGEEVLVAASNILKFENTSKVSDEKTLEDVNALGIRLNDNNKNGKYFLYNKAGKLNNLNDRGPWKMIAAYDPTENDIQKKSVLQIENDDTIEWLIPKENSMINLITPYNEETSTHYIIRQVVSVEYTLQEYLKHDYMNNIIQVKLIKDGVQFIDSAELFFGSAGTSGSDYTLTINWLNNKLALNVEDPEDVLQGEIVLLDSSGEEVDLKDATIEPEWHVAINDVYNAAAEDFIYEDETRDLYYPIIFKNLFKNNLFSLLKNYFLNYYYSEGVFPGNFNFQTAFQGSNSFSVDSENGTEDTYSVKNYSDENVFVKILRTGELEILWGTNSNNSQETSFITDRDNCFIFLKLSINFSMLEKEIEDEESEKKLNLFTLEENENSDFFEDLEFLGTFIEEDSTTINLEEKDYYYYNMEQGNFVKCTEFQDPSKVTFYRQCNKENQEVQKKINFKEIDFDFVKNKLNIPFVDFIRKTLFVKYNDQYILMPWDNITANTEIFYIPTLPSKIKKANLDLICDIDTSKRFFNIYQKTLEGEPVLSINSLYILKLKILDVLEYPLEAYYPIPLNTGEIPYILGATTVRYSTDGELDYYKNSYDCPVGTDNTNYYWQIIYNINSIDNEQENVNFLPSLKDNFEDPLNVIDLYKNPILIPVGVYVENAKPYGVQLVEFVNNVKTPLWTQPIFVYQDNYPSTTLNRWNGKDIEINEDNGTIVANGFAAGRKEQDNTFTGVVLGDWSRTDIDKSFTSKTTGVFGFNHGAMSYALKDDGTAFFGKDGRGRLYLNGNKASIYSANWNLNQTGMMFDLDDGILQSNKSLYINKNQNYFIFSNFEEFKDFLEYKLADDFDSSIYGRIYDDKISYYYVKENFNNEFLKGRQKESPINQVELDQFYLPLFEEDNVYSSMDELIDINNYWSFFLDQTNKTLMGTDSFYSQYLYFSNINYHNLGSINLLNETLTEADALRLKKEILQYIFGENIIIDLEDENYELNLSYLKNSFLGINFDNIDQNIIDVFFQRGNNDFSDYKRIFLFIIYSMLRVRKFLNNNKIFENFYNSLPSNRYFNNLKKVLKVYQGVPLQSERLLLQLFNQQLNNNNLYWTIEEEGSDPQIISFDEDFLNNDSTKNNLKQFYNIAIFYYKYAEKLARGFKLKEIKIEVENKYSIDSEYNLKYLFDKKCVLGFNKQSYSLNVYIKQDIYSFIKKDFKDKDIKLFENEKFLKIKSFIDIANCPFEVYKGILEEGENCFITENSSIIKYPLYFSLQNRDDLNSNQNYLLFELLKNKIYEEIKEDIHIFEDSNNEDNYYYQIEDDLNYCYEKIELLGSLLEREADSIYYKYDEEHQGFQTKHGNYIKIYRKESAENPEYESFLKKIFYLNAQYFLEKEEELRGITLSSDEEKYPLSIGVGLDPEKRRFRVDWDGRAYLKNAFIEGEIIATMASFGGWGIRENVLYSEEQNTILNGKTGIISTNYIDLKGPFEKKDSTNNIYSGLEDNQDNPENIEVDNQWTPEDAEINLNSHARLGEFQGSTGENSTKVMGLLTSSSIVLQTTPGGPGIYHGKLCTNGMRQNIALRAVGNVYIDAGYLQNYYDKNWNPTSEDFEQGSELQSLANKEHYSYLTLKKSGLFEIKSKIVNDNNKYLYNINSSADGLKINAKENDYDTNFSEIKISKNDIKISGIGGDTKHFIQLNEIQKSDKKYNAITLQSYYSTQYGFIKATISDNIALERYSTKITLDDNITLQNGNDNNITLNTNNIILQNILQNDTTTKNIILRNVFQNGTTTTVKNNITLGNNIALQNGTKNNITLNDNNITLQNISQNNIDTVVLSNNSFTLNGKQIATNETVTSTVTTTVNNAVNGIQSWVQNNANAYSADRLNIWLIDGSGNWVPSPCQVTVNSNGYLVIKYS